MTERYAHVDDSTNPPMSYLVARECPKLLEGHKFYACRCFGPAVAAQEKPSILVSCQFLASVRTRGVVGHGTPSTIVCCNYGGEKNAGSGVQFGVPTVMHAEEPSDGGNKD